MNPIAKNDHLIYDFYGQGKTELESCISLYGILLCSGYSSVIIGKLATRPREKDPMFISYRDFTYLIKTKKFECLNNWVFYLSYLVWIENPKNIRVIPYKGSIEKEKKD